MFNVEYEYNKKNNSVNIRILQYNTMLDVHKPEIKRMIKTDAEREKIIPALSIRVTR